VKVTEKLRGRLTSKEGEKMKKFGILLLVLIFVFVNTTISRAETARKKVVKVKPAQIEESPTPVKTTRISPRSLEEESSAKGKTPPKAQPVSGKGSGAAGESGFYEKGPSGLFVAVKGGFAMPRAMAGAEVGTTFVSNVMDKTDLTGRLGVGYLKGFGFSAWSVYGDVFLSWDVLRSKQLPLTLNLGVGLNYPVSVNDNQTGNLGFNVFLGLNYDILEKGQLFVESGFHTFAIKDKDTRNGVSCLIGYKQFF
jgi:hypothetical protein